MTEPTPDVLTPAAGDRKTRTTGPPTDPEAPYGYMKDPKTGETRAKKRPGKTSGPKVEAPPKRPANKARPRMLDDLP